MTTTTLAQDRFGHTIQCMAPGTVQNVAFNASTSTATSALSSDTSVVRLFATVDCYVAIGNPATASNASMYLPAATPEYFRVQQGFSQTVAALGVAASGTLNVVEMA